MEKKKKLVFQSVYDSIGSFAAVQEWNRWEQLMALLNQNVPVTLGPAYQTSDTWIRVFTEVAAVNGIQQGLLISCAIAVLGLVIFSGNIIVALMATIVLIVNIIMMLAFYKIMDWDIGIIEAVSLFFSNQPF